MMGDGLVNALENSKNELVEKVYGDKEKIRIPISKDDIVRLEGILSEYPSLKVIGETSRLLESPLYRVSVNGVDVSPEDLVMKKNGHRMASIKDIKEKFLHNADVDNVDVDDIKLHLATTTVFSIASVATSQYYLKNIDSKLSEIKKDTEDIKNFLNVDKQSKIEGDFELLKGIAEQLDSIRSDESLFLQKGVQVASIQKDAKGNIRFYERYLEEALDQYKREKNRGKGLAKIIRRLSGDYFYYKLSLQVYALSRLVELMLLSEYKESYIASVREDLEELSKNFSNNTREASSIIYRYGYKKRNAQTTHFLANMMKGTGKALGKSPLKATKLDRALIKQSESSDARTRAKIQKTVDSVLGGNSERLLESYVEMVDDMGYLVGNRVRIEGSEGEMFIVG